MDRLGAKWIWLPGFQDSDTTLPGKFVLFRKTLNLSEVLKTPCVVNVSADTRYRLFINGTSVAFGPCKSYPGRWFYETIDITPYLRVGNNVITAKILRFFPGQAGSFSMAKANVPGFILWGDLGGQPIITDESWLCCEDRSIRLRPRSEWNYILGPPFLSLDEDVTFSNARLDWQDESADLANWSSAVPAVAPMKMLPAVEPWRLQERPIPLLPEIPSKFYSAIKCSGTPELEQWNNLLRSDTQITIHPNQEVSVEFDSEVLTTGFLEFDFLGGRDAEVSILYAESYEKDLGTDKAPFPLPRHKGDRRDWKDGRLYGMYDQVTLSAADGEKTCYEPFWFRTFQFIKLKIICKDTPLQIHQIKFRETRYPLEITTNVSLTPSLQKVWDICLNTLQNCMHETYEDCPYYEQNQFAMDSRLQLLFTYQISRDDALARKTIHEFHASRRCDGLLETNSPVSTRAINIPQFSLYWILMLHDHMMYFGDAKLLRNYLGTADGILNHFDALVNKDGFVGRFDPECWAFIDWVKEWHGTKGIRDMAVPPIYKKTGVAAYNSLLYSMVLQHAADVNAFAGRHDTANEYRQRADALNNAVNTHCWNGTFYLDGPGAAETCEHTQIFAILSGAISGNNAAELLHRTIADTTMPRCSYAMKHYVFRAMSKTGLYEEYFARMMRTWDQMVQDNLTTCAEDDVGFRSDCHGWSASPIYEIVAEVCGVKPVRPGMVVAKIEPRRRLLEESEVRYRMKDGDMCVKWSETGDVDVQYGGEAKLEVQGVKPLTNGVHEH